MAAPIILVEAQPRRAADGVAETVRLGGGGGALPFTYGGAHWRAGIEALPTIVASLDYDQEIVGGGVAQAMTLSFAPGRQASIAELAAYFWPDAAIVVRIGPEGSLPPIVAQGKVTEIVVADGKLAIALADPAADLMKPLLTARYAGTGGLEGPEAWEGLIKRRVWGRVWNLQAEPIDPANNVYCLADPLRPLLAIVAVRDRGAAAADLGFLAWQGTAEATLAALQAAVAPAGSGVVCPSIACIKWWTEPSGDLNADVLGEVGGGYVETSATIAERLVQALGGPAFVADTVATASALRSAPVGWVAKDDSTTVAAMLDDLMANVSLMWLLSPTGEIIIRPWAWGASVASAISQDVSRQKMLRPVTTRRLGYQRNEAKMARGDLAAIVLANEVEYLDGTAAQDVQPAEAGADVTGGITGVGEIIINSDYAGAITDALPRYQQYRLVRNGVDATAGATWSIDVVTGTIDATIDAAGLVSLDQSGGILTPSVLRVQATFGTRSYQMIVRASKSNGGAPSDGSGGGTASGGGFSGVITSATMVAIGPEISVTAGSAGAVDLYADYSFSVAVSSGSYALDAQWYRWNGTAYVAVGSAQGSSDPAVAKDSDGVGACAFNDSGLVAASVQKYQLWMRAPIGAADRYVTGSYAAVGS